MKFRKVSKLKSIEFYNKKIYFYYLKKNFVGFLIVTKFNLIYLLLIIKDLVLNFCNLIYKKYYTKFN